MPVSVPQSLLWPLPVLVRCSECWGCLSDLITFWIYEEELHKRRSPNVLFKATGALMNCHFIGSFSFPLQCTKRWFIWSLSVWLCVLASPHIDYTATGKKVEINTWKRTDFRSCFEDTLSNPISDGRIPSLPQLPTQKYVHPISSTTPCFKGYFSSCGYQVTELSDCRAEE